MRDKKIVDIRPSLNLNSEYASELENFQNNTLRPILKLQDPLTHQLLYNSEHFKKIRTKIDVSNNVAFSTAVHKFVSTNVVFKNRLIGCIIGMMTKEEFNYYSNYASEINKRILSMQVQRYADNAVEKFTN